MLANSGVHWPLFIENVCFLVIDLLQLIHRSSSPNPVAELIQGVWDFKKWMEPYLALIEGHSKYHVFRFTLDASKRAVLHYKQFSTMPWEPKNSGVYMLSVRNLLRMNDYTFMIIVYTCVFRMQLIKDDHLHISLYLLHVYPSLS